MRDPLPHCNQSETPVLSRFAAEISASWQVLCVKGWLEELELHGLGRDIPRILVGNKCDEGRQQVPTPAAQRWADDR
jgi:hypothetical protein